MNKLSIIVVAYNEANNLKRLKQSIDSQKLPVGWRIETILIDNGSHDDTYHIAVRLGFTKVVEDAGKTVATCRNRGIKEATGDIVSYVDADCELKPTWVQSVILCLGGGELSIAGWPVEPPLPMTWVQYAWHEHWVNKRGHIEGDIVGERAMTLITTANMSMTADVFDFVEGFNEQLRSGEDMNFVLRAYKKGVTLCACPKLRIIHHGEPRNLKQFYRQQRWHCSKNSFLQIIKTNKALQGANAMWFTLAYTFLLGVLMISMFLAFAYGVVALLGTIPFVLILGLPAWIIAKRASKMNLLFLLPILYLIYGLVRMLDGMGFGYKRIKRWR